MSALVLIVVLGLTDYLDGIMARRDGTSVLGSLLDPIADKIFIAAIYLPLTERGVIPAWMTACIFARDFLVTSLRTNMFLNDAPMRTSTLAKFKTAIQMTASGFIVALLIWGERWPSYALFSATTAIPLALILYRLLKKQKQGLRSTIMFAMFMAALGFYVAAGTKLTIISVLYLVTFITIYSGLSYLADGWSSLKTQPGRAKEVTRFILEGICLPTTFVLLLGRYDTFGISALIILIITSELAVGGLGNFLASKKIRPKFRAVTLKTAAQILLGVAALWLDRAEVSHETAIGELCVVAAFAINCVYVIGAFWRHRLVYLGAL